MSRFFQVLILTALLIPGSFSSCTSTTKKSTDRGLQIDPEELARQEYLAKYIPWEEAKQITRDGNNWKATYSEQGDRIRYSSSTNGYTQADIYELNLNSGKTKRLTFQSGLAEEAAFVPLSEALFYRSNVDELKERPKLFEALTSARSGAAARVQLPELAPLEGHELYYREDREAVPKRLTQTPGFDGWASIHPNGNHFVYSTIGGNKLQINQSEIKGNPKSIPLISRTNHVGFPRYSPSGNQLLWIEYNENPLTSGVYIGKSNGKDPQKIIAFDGTITYPSWHPSEGLVIFSGKGIQQEGFAVYALNLRGNCLTELFRSQADLLHPSFSPDGLKVLMTIESPDFRQVYEIPIVLDRTVCPVEEQLETEVEEAEEPETVVDLEPPSETESNSITVSDTVTDTVIDIDADTDLREHL